MGNLSPFIRLLSLCGLLSAPISGYGQPAIPRPIPNLLAKEVTVDTDDLPSFPSEEGFQRDQLFASRDWLDGFVSTEKIYVTYSKSGTERVSIDYETGSVLIEGLEDANPVEGGRALAQKRQSAEVRAREFLVEILTESVLLPEEKKGTHLENPSLLNFFREDLFGLRAPNPAGRRQKQKAKVSLVKNHLSLRENFHFPKVQEISKHFRLDARLVMALIRKESVFNPRARSKVPAFGLMQIVPKHAGREAFKFLTTKDQTPTPSLLYQPNPNLVLGISYLKILRDRYLQVAAGSVNEIHLLTASFNYGPSRLMTALSRGELNLKEGEKVFLAKLNARLPKETRDYVRIVSKYYSEYKKRMPAQAVNNSPAKDVRR